MHPFIEVFTIQQGKFLRKYEKRFYENSIAALSRDTIAKHYWLIWMQGILEINFGGVQVILEKTLFFSLILKQIEVFWNKTFGQLEVEVKTYRMRF